MIGTLFGGEEGIQETKPDGIGLDEIHTDFTTEHIVRKISRSSMDIGMIIESNRALIQHFSKVGQSKEKTERINLEFVDSLLQQGADINATDKTGQTVLHEVSGRNSLQGKMHITL